MVFGRAKFVQNGADEALELNTKGTQNPRFLGV
jgi:hypothetical protein